MTNFRTTLAILLLATAAAGACSSNPNKGDKTPIEGTGPEASTQPAASDTPPAPLEFVEAEPEATKVTSLEETTEYRIGKMRLIHKLTPANPVVAARLFIVGGQHDLTAETAGIAKLAMTVATTGGTESTPKDAFNARLDATGAAVWSFADRDYSGYGLKTLVGNFDQNWTLFEQAILEPAFPQDEVALRRTKHLAEIASLFENPDSQLSYVGARHMFEGHPYYHLHIGTKENVESFSRNDLLRFQRSLLSPDRFTFVVVGNVPAEKVIAKIKARFGRLAGQEYEAPEPATWSSKPGLVREPRELPTNYILGYFAAPRPGEDDYAAMLVAVDYLRERLFEEVRTKRNLTYAVSSGMSDSATNYGYLYVTAVEPEKTLAVMFEQIEALQTGTLTEDQLQQTLNVFITKYYMDLEQNGSQAALLANSQLVAGDWKATANLLEEVRQVTPEDIKRVAAKYFGGYRFAVVGPKEFAIPQ